MAKKENKKMTEEEVREILHSRIEKVTTRINNNQLTSLDPILGDNACQMRAYALVRIARKVKQGIDLSPQEENLLVILEAMSDVEISKIEMRKIGIPAKEICDTKGIPSYLKGSVEGKKTFEKINYSLKASLINACIDVLQSDVEVALNDATNSGDEDLRLLLEQLKDSINDESMKEVNRNSLHEHLNALPLFANGMAMLTLERMAGQPIIISIFRYEREYLANSAELLTSLNLRTINTLMFVPDENGKFSMVPSPTEEQANIPALHYGCYNIIDKDGEDPGFGLFQHDLNGYIEAINEIDNIDEILLAFHALHPQYPSIRNCENSEAIADYQKPGAPLSEEYVKHRYIIPAHHGLKNNQLLFGEDKDGIIPLSIRHVNAGTFKEILDNDNFIINNYDPNLDALVRRYEPSPSDLDLASKSLELKNLSAEFEVVDVLGDGNCFYRAIGEIIGREHTDLRQMVVQASIDASDELEPFLIRHHYGDFENYISTIERNGNWADSLEIFILSRTLESNIIIHHNDGHIIEFGNHNNGRDINLFYTGNHYLALRSLNNPFLEENNLEIDQESISITYGETPEQSLDDMTGMLGLVGLLFITEMSR